MPARNRTIVPLLAVLGALLAPASASALEVGLNVNGGAAAGAADFAQLSDTGSKWARHFLYWRDITPQGWASYELIAREEQARGVKTLITINGAGAAPDPAAYADYAGRLATRLRGLVDAYEIYNEADGTDFWHGSTPASYTDVLRRAYTAIKSADPNAKVVFSPTVGNNFEWLEQAYKAGAKGYFDAMAVHTDTACSVASPGEYYRDEQGRIARFTFLGYRTVRQTMLDHDDPKPIWMTEFGWSVAPGLCERGTWAGKKNAGVSEPQQAQFLREAYHCMKEDPYVEVAMWFNSRDLVKDTTELNNYGLKRFDGTDRPAVAALRDVTAGRDTITGPCGDFVGPQLKVLAPQPGWMLAPNEPLMMKATSSDPTVARISFSIKGQSKALRNVSDFRTMPSLNWMGAKQLPLGRHTVVVTALDPSGNKTVVEVPGQKIDISKLKAKRVSFFGLKVGGTGRVRTVRGRVKSTLRFSIPGKVVAEWQHKRGGRWRKTHGAARNANKPFRFKQTLKYGGQWRVRLKYSGVRPFKRGTSKWIAFRA